MADTTRQEIEMTLGITRDLALAREAQRAGIRAVREVAEEIRDAIGRQPTMRPLLRQVEDLAEVAERQRRQVHGLRETYLGTVSDAVSLVLVSMIAEAVRVTTERGRGRRLRRTLPLAALVGRMDYVLALRLVAMPGVLDALWAGGLSPQLLRRAARLASYDRLILGRAS